jgi:hypothetical protein
LRVTGFPPGVGENGEKDRLCRAHSLGQLGYERGRRNQLELVAANQLNIATPAPDLGKEIERVRRHISISARSALQSAGGEGCWSAPSTSQQRNSWQGC